MKHETVHEHAKRIGELYNSVSEIALCERKAFEDYDAAFLVSTAENILDIMQDWADGDYYDQRVLAAEKRKLQNFIKKWGAQNDKL